MTFTSIEKNIKNTSLFLLTDEGVHVTYSTMCLCKIHDVCDMYSCCVHVSAVHVSAFLADSFTLSISAYNMLILPVLRFPVLGIIS